jgi:glucuronoarabinoxylan endo-1,4-beta-xylanase
MSIKQKRPFIVSVAVMVFLFSGIMQVSSQTVTVDFSKTKQIIDGFGGSSAWSGKFSDAVMDLLYNNASNQLGYTILRSRIDPNKSWADEKSNTQKAKARGATTFATPWSPPASMKTNNSVNNGGEIKSTEWGNYAKYLKEYIDYVGTDLDIISLQNEPDWHPDYESCAWNATQFKDFCKNYASTLERPVMMPEALGFNFALSDPTLDDPDAAKNVSYIGGHLYGSQPKTYTKAINLGKHVWMTEFNQDDDSPSGVMTIAKQVLDCMYNSFNGYVWWWMLDWGNGLVTSQGGTKKKAWAIAQFSKWVRPGYYRVEATYNPQTDVYVVAFKGAQNVTVAINRATSSKSQTFTYTNATVTSVQKYTSSGSKNAVNDGTITAANNSFTATLDAQSTTTFVSTGSTAVLPYRNEDGRYAIEKASVAAAQSDAMGPFFYLINGKRGYFPRMYELRRPSQGIYIMDGTVHASVGRGKLLHASKK